jgi:hypothetical protein
MNLTPLAIGDVRALPIHQPGQPVVEDSPGHGRMYCGHMEGGTIGRMWVVRRLLDGTYVRECSG